MDETWDDMRIFKIAEQSSQLPGFVSGAFLTAYKLSCFPKTLVGIADVKLSPNSSL